MLPPAPRPSEVDASRRETVQLEADLGSMLAAVDEAPAAAAAPPTRPSAASARSDPASLGSMLAAVDEAPPRKQKKKEQRGLFQSPPVPSSRKDAEPRRHAARARADGGRAHDRAGGHAAASTGGTVRGAVEEAQVVGGARERPRRRAAETAPCERRRGRRETSPARGREGARVAAADVGGLVGLFEGAVEKHKRDKARRLSTVSDLSAAAKARRRSSIVGGGMRCTFTNVSQSPAVLIVAVEAPAGLVLEHVHRSLDDDSEPAWVRAEDNRIEVTIDAPGAYVFAARGVNVATGTVLCEARTAVFELNEPTATLESLAPPLKDDATAVRSRAGRRSSVVFDVGAKRLWLSEHVRFHGNATTIHEDSSELIDQLALMLRTHPNVDSVRLEGHTNSKCGLDCVGGDHKCSNGLSKTLRRRKGGAVAFSLGRAQAVADALVARGIDRARLNCVAWPGRGGCRRHRGRRRTRQAFAWKSRG